MSDTQIGPTLPPGMARDRRDDGRKGSGCSVGPTLPPHFKLTQSSKLTSLGSDDEDAGGTGPTIPCMDRGRLLLNPNTNCNNEGLDIGPSLPPYLRKSQSPEGPSLPSKSTHKDTDSDDGDAEATYGPSLPPSYTKQSQILGPSLPPGFRRPCEGEVDKESDEEFEDDSSGEEVIGPMPASEHECRQWRSAAEELEARAAAMKNKLTKKVQSLVKLATFVLPHLPERV